MRSFCQEFHRENDSTSRTLYYFSTDLAAGFGRDPRFPRFLHRFGMCDALLKSASFLPHWRMCDSIRPARRHGGAVSGLRGVEMECTAVRRVQPPGPAISARVPEGPCKSISVQSECPRARLLARIRSRETVIEPNAGAEDQASVAEMRRRGIEGVAEHYCQSYRRPFAPRR
jgi:hypothetical protein